MARPSNPFFNAHHSPMGAFATLTFGAKGSRGGMGLEMAKPADQPVYIGVEDSQRPGEYAAFPFFEGGSDEAARYDVENESAESSFPAAPLRTFADGDVAREFGPATDEWSAPGLAVRVITPNWSIPDPIQGSGEAFRRAIRPAMLIEIEVDNTQGRTPRRCFIGTTGSALNANLRPLETPGLTGFAQGREWGMACAEGEMKTAFHFSAGQALAIDLESNRRFFIAPTGLLIGEAAPGEGGSWKEVLLAELAGQLDLTRVHFFGRLRDHPEAPRGSDTIYRYDREGLLAALAAVRHGRAVGGGR